MISLQFDHVSKRYRIPEKEQHGGGLLERIRHRFSPQQDFWAVRDVSFEVPSGQALGIIGHNGAGKSTVLKLLSSITVPSSGQIVIRGRLTALLEVGSGFHPELTGRENVFLSGSILGMKRREIHAKLDQIIDFAEIRPFIDVPVKRYSSGMYVRLGFSIAAHLEPDILLLDEVLAVGDAAFQQKCTDRIQTLKREGLTIVFISHDLQAVELLCDRVLVMQRGQMIFDGAPRDAADAYTQTRALQYSSRSKEVSATVAEITSLTILDSSGAPVNHLSTGDPVRVRLEYLAHGPVPNARFDVFFNSGDGHLLCQFSSRFSGPRLDLEAGPGAIEFNAPELALQSGLYRLDATIEQVGASDPLDWLVGCGALHVSGGRLHALFYHPHTWHLHGEL